ncbi:MAG: NlpC/P60 family protein [Rhodospirillales bacterium]|nr:NlpC/P60 family protein [Rhodospirillales bacterium]
MGDATIAENAKDFANKINGVGSFAYADESPYNGSQWVRTYKIDKNNQKILMAEGPALDCSHFVSAVLHQSGYAIPYNNVMPTGLLTSDGKTLSSEAAKYFDLVPKNQISKGDLVLFKGHLTIANGPVDPDKKTGSFIGDNSSTGVAVQKYTTETNATVGADGVYYWGLESKGKPFQFALRKRGQSRLFCRKKLRRQTWRG